MGWGLCLYLALMKHTLGNDFTLAVLDDVLMSVDVGHRREVCQLLKTKFGKTQFILTTHDPVWLQFMRTEHLIQGSISFGGWTVDSGPQVWSEEDVWKQIEDKLKHSDVRRRSGDFASVFGIYLHHPCRQFACATSNITQTDNMI